MDEFLDELYGTSGIIGEDDMEKQAAAEFLVKLAEDEGVDLDNLSDEEIGGLMAEIEGGEMEDESQEKLAEADFLGRAMAHAYVNELYNIEKQAKTRGVKPDQIKNFPQQPTAAQAAKFEAQVRADQAAKVERARKAADTPAGKGYSGGSSVSDAEWKARETGMGERAAHKRRGRLGRAGRYVAEWHRGGAQQVREAIRRKGKGFAHRAGLAARGLGKFAPAAALAAGAGYGGYKALSKKSFDEEFEAMAEQRALEMLEHAGYDVEKVASDDYLDTRALEMLEHAGYPVVWE